MDIPADVKIATSIEQGTVCLFEIEHEHLDGTKIKKKRFFIILNSDPKSDSLLVITTITSQVQKKKDRIKNTGENPATLVELSPSDFPLLSVPSIVDCNSVIECSKSVLAKKIDKGGKYFFEKLPKPLILKIQSGALISTQVSQDFKKLIV